MSQLFARVHDRIELLKRLPWAGPGLLAALVLLTLWASAAPAVTAVAVGWLIARLSSAGPGALAAPLAAYATALLGGHLIAAVRQPLSYLAEARIDGRHRADLSRLAASSPTIGELERSEVQMLIRTARADPHSFMDGTPGAGALAQLDLIGRALALGGAAVVLAAYAWWAAPLLLAGAVAVHQLRWEWGRRWRAVWRNVVRPSMHADMWSDALLSPGEGKDIRVFGLGGYALDRIDEHQRAAYVPLWPVGRRMLADQWQELAAIGVPLGIVFVAVAVDGAQGLTPVAVATAALVAGTGVYEAFEDAPRATINATTCLQAYRRLRAALAAPREQAPSPRRPEALRLEARRPEARRPEGGRAEAGPETGGPPTVRFEGVSFRYPGTDHTVLDGLDLEIRPGELLAIVGVNGAGKSTLIKLLAGLFEPTSGRITADGRDVDPIAWRRRLSVVFQDFVRYHLSAADNVTLGNALAPRDLAAVQRAAREAGLDEVVKHLPDGWDTPLARTRTGGVDLSGGQWQQVALARALYALHTGAQILVLDEPTAHLDVRTERDVFARLAAHRGNASVILISHRLSTVRQADRIVLVDGGRITESGTHDELMTADGEYAAMFTIQAQRFRRGFDDRLEEGDLR